MAIDGRGFAYVFPCVWEDHCKIGFSIDPLRRLQSLHPRWFEQFDIDRILLVQSETVRDARDLELRLRRPLSSHNAPPPSTIQPGAGGHTEWFRGVGPTVSTAVDALRAEGYPVHAGRPWLAEALDAFSDRLFEWSLAQFGPDDLERGPSSATRHVRDALDAHAALGIGLEDKLPPAVWRWHLRASAL